MDFQASGYVYSAADIHRPADEEHSTNNGINIMQLPFSLD